MSATEKVDVDSQKLFNSWSAKSVASILVDGQKLNDVFDLIKQQLDYLLRRQLTLESQLSSHVEMTKSQSQETVAPPMTTTPKSVGGGFGNGFDPLLAESLRNEMENFKLLIRNSNQENEKKISTLEKSLQSQLQSHEVKLHTHTTTLQYQGNQQESYQQRLEQVESRCNQLSSLLSSMNDRFHEIEKTIENNHKEYLIELHNLQDALAVHDLRYKQVENRLSNTATLTEKIHQIIENYPEKYFIPMTQDITTLQVDKANRQDLETKADISILLNKADQSSLSSLEGLVEELEHRLASLKVENMEKWTSLDQKMDRRVDRIVSYCLKELRKELKQYALVGEEDGLLDGTDIGKVRCLVCNQVTNQQRMTEIVFGGPQLKNTMPVRSRPRSPSPPPPSGQTNNNTNNTTTNNYPNSPGGGGGGGGGGTGRPLPSERPDRPESAKYPKSHARMVKMGASPMNNNNNTNANNNNNGSIADLDDTGDFNYRTSSRPQSAYRTTSYEQQDEQYRRSGGGGGGGDTLVRITSTQHADGYRVSGNNNNGNNAIYSRTAPPAAYKEVEERLVKKVTNPSSQAVKQVEVMLHRPKSAPMRRTQTSAKLQPMGLPTPVVH